MSDLDRPTCEWLFGKSLLNGKALQDAVFQHYPKGECEKVTVTEFSEKPVEDDEVLTRLIVHPIHMDPQTGLVSPLAFNDATTLDLSVFRELRATNAEIQLSIDEIKNTGAHKVPPQTRLINNVMQATAGEIRALKFKGNDQAMCRIYDTAEPAKPAHASVFTPTVARRGAEQREVRRSLLALFSRQVINVDQYRDLAY